MTDINIERTMAAVQRYGTVCAARGMDDAAYKAVEAAARQDCAAHAQREVAYHKDMLSEHEYRDRMEQV